MKLLTLATIILLMTIPTIHADDRSVTRNVHIVYVQPIGEEFTTEEQERAFNSTINAANYWHELSPITTTINIAATYFITTEHDVLHHPSMLTQLNTGILWQYNDLILFVVDNSESNDIFYDLYEGMANFANIYIVLNVRESTYAHEFGHALYRLPHQYQAEYDIMNLYPESAYVKRTIGCATLKELGRECYKVYFPVVVQ